MLTEKVFFLIIDYQIGFKCCHVGWHVCGQPFSEWCYKEEGEHVYMNLGEADILEVSGSADVCCKVPASDTLAVAPSAYKNVCRSDLLEFETV